MAIIQPFAAIRPAPEKASHIAALPYDVYSTAEAREEVAKEPLSFLRIDRAEVQFEKGVSPYEEKVYEKASETLWGMVDKGEFLREEKKCYYVYELTMGQRVQTGIAAVASIDDYQNGIIKRHENTRPQKEADRIRHVDVCHAQTGPIYLAYRSNDTINAIVEAVKSEEALYDFIAPDGIRHRVFRIGEEDQILQMEAAFAETESIYIADGHHRAASAVKVGMKRRETSPDYNGAEEFNYFLSVLFPDDQLMILDYNRVVKDLNGLGNEIFLERVRALFPTEANKREDKRPIRRGEFSLYLAGDWYTCTIPEEYKSGDPVRDLDVSVLQDRLFAPILDITEPEKDKRLDFVGGIRGMEELERRAKTDCAAAFAMYPSSIAELFAAADAGLLMPAKSTWFEPKLRSGLFIHEIEE